MFWRLICFLLRGVARLRYRIETKGLKEAYALAEEKGSGILILPNHTAHIESILLFLYLWPRFRMRPLVVEYVYRNRFARPFMQFVKALPIPNFDTSVNQLKLNQAERSIGEIARELKAGNNFILYPSGRLKTSAKEVIGGASGTQALLQECPDARVILVRTTGLWGSMFSRAIEGRPPDISKTFWRGFKTFLRNFIFLCPRRRVTVEFEVAPADFPRKGTRLEVNRYLENWYNSYPDAEGRRQRSEPLQLVSYSFWRKDLLEPYQPKEKTGSSFDGVIISDDTRHHVYAEIRRILNNPEIAIEDEMDLAFDLGMDSLNVAELLAFLSRKYDVSDIHPEDLSTVRSALEMAAGTRVSEQPAQPASRFSWPDEPNRPDVELPAGKTISAAFLHSCERLGALSACGDNLSGVLNYKRLKKAALVLAQYFRKMEGKTVAVMLPASVGAYLIIFALELAGKTPVMLNWTLGPRYLEEMMRISGATKVISSWSFLERLSHVDFGKVIDQLMLIEDIRGDLTLWMKLRGAYLSLRSAKTILEKLGLDEVDEDSPAVILFTSGTEAVPKGVPLSHKNLLTNLRSGMQCMPFQGDDIVYGILPPFHSFGFSVAGILSFLSGMRIAFYPDPTDSFALAEGIERWNVTLFCGAPTFYRGLFQAAKPNQLETVRFFVVGAEKASQELYDKANEMAPSSKMIEGYGVTECSPALTLNRPNLPPKGVGRPLPDVEVCTIHLETQELLPPGSEGEICVRGPNIFNGYLGNPRSPFIELEGKVWYRTGDIGYLDPEGSLILSGRLKRFTKMGGEMISLGAVEEAINAELLKKGRLSLDSPGIALCADERILGKPQLILFSTVALSREEVNELLKTAGFSRLIKISAIHQIEEIPVMGTGKIDYRKLQSAFA